MSAFPNPIRGVWYAEPLGPLLDSPCYGCRRGGLRRAYVMIDDEICHHHLVRDGVTMDCTGPTWLVDRWFQENPGCDRRIHRIDESSDGPDLCPSCDEEIS